MFNSRNPYASTHQSRRIRHTRNRRDVGSKLEIIEIDAPEHDAFACRSRKNSKRGILSRVQSYATELDRTGDRLLAHRLAKRAIRRPNNDVCILNSLQTKHGPLPCTFVHNCCEKEAVADT